MIVVTPCDYQALGAAASKESHPDTLAITGRLTRNRPLVFRNSAGE
jgi:hypothetical protein